MTDEEATKFIDECVARISEHFDSVQILASRRHPAAGGTQALMRGAGDWYARQGMAHEFIDLDRAKTQAHEIANEMDRK
jgi:hypothetical protein